MTNKKLYLIGDPVDHSLSPLLHGAMIAQTGVHYTYEVRRVQPRDLADFVAEAKAGGCAGFNVTMPHKEAILPLLDELSPAAAACGAVNTVCIKNGRAIGYNTDGRGFVDSLRARGLEPEGKTVLLLGTGGAGDAICDALVGAGVKRFSSPTAASIRPRIWPRVTRIRRSSSTSAFSPSAMPWPRATCSSMPPPWAWPA